MAGDETLPTADPGSESRAIQPHRADEELAVDHRMAPPPDEATQAGGLGIGVYLHAVRRRWLLATTLGLLGAGAGASVFWFMYSKQYTAVAMLRVASTEQPILFATAERSTAFDIYKATQQQYVKSRFVLIAALRKPAVASLPVVQRQADPADWLTWQLRVEYPGNAEIMNVSLRGEDPEATAALVNAVIEAYMAEIVDVEQNQRRQRLGDLERVYAEKELELRNKRTALKQLAGQLGTGERETLTLKQQIALQQYATFRNEVVSLQFSIMKMQSELKRHEGELERLKKLEISDVEMDALAQGDAAFARLLDERNRLNKQLEETERVMTSASAANRVQRIRSSLEGVERQMKVRRDELRKLVHQRKETAVKSEIDRLQGEIGIVGDQQEQLSKELEQAKKQSEAFGGSSIDVEMMRTEIHLLDGVLNSIADERQKLLIELRSKPRITLLRRADVPRQPDRTRIIQTAMFACLAGFAVPFGCIVWWDSRARRISSPIEVSLGTGLDVIGAVPLVPGRAFGSEGLSSRQDNRWRMLMNESVDGIAARLIHKAEHERIRVVLVSSAVSGEGKTTLATQLAMSLARTNHCTLLVDFDLRRPEIDEVFDLALSPGVSDILRGESEAQQTLQPASVENLWVLAAGSHDRRTLNSLASGRVRQLFKELRSRFEFIVVDGSPILPVVDTRFLCQHVDGVVLSIFRDVSRLPQVLTACEILAGFGVRPLGAVVTGSSLDIYYHTRAYQTIDA